MALLIRLDLLVKNHKKNVGSQLIIRYFALILNCPIARIRDHSCRDWSPQQKQKIRLKRTQSKKLSVLYKQSHSHLGHASCLRKTHPLDSPQILQFKRYLLESYRQNKRKTMNLNCLKTTFRNERKVNPWLYQCENHRLTNKQISEGKKVSHTSKAKTNDDQIYLI